MANNYIPSDILIEIMKRLPVKSLMLSKSVSKRWKSIIDNSKLISNNQVINHAKLQHGLLVGYFVKEDGCDKLHGYFLDDDGILPQHKFSLTFPVDRHQILIGLSQGLLCFYSHHANPNGFGLIKTAVIWNPAIKKSVVVPDVFDELPYNCLTVFGFAVCPHASEPKLVNIICRWKILKEFKSLPDQRVKIFTLSSGVWRSSHSNNQPRKSISFTKNQVVIDGFIYWLAFDLINYSHMIVSFDTITEDFTEVYLPDSLTRGNILISRIRESLVVLEDTFWSNVRVWMMQNGDPKSFTEIFTINTQVSIRDVLGFRKSGEPIIFIKNGTEVPGLHVYDPNSEQINYIGILGKFHSVFAASYMESLLLLDKTDCYINFDIN